MTKDISTIEKSIMDKAAEVSSKISSVLKIKVNTKDLIRALDNMRNITDKSGTIEGLSDVKITAQDNFITIEATDIDVYLYQRIGATVIKAGEGRLDSATFFMVISSIKDEFIEISQQEKGNKLEIIGEHCYFSLPALPTTEFPHMEDVTGGTKLSLNCSDLDKVINYTKFAMSLDETRYNLNGLYFHVRDNKFYSAATDGHRLSIASASSGFTYSDNNPSNNNFGVILPQKTIDKLTKIFKAGESEVDIILSVNKIKFSFNDGKIILISKIIDGKFPDYSSFIPQNNQNKLTVNKELFELIIKRVSTVTLDKFKAIKINIGKDMIEITSASSPKGSAREVLKFSSDKDKLCMLERGIEDDNAGKSENLENSNNNLTIGCNSKYLEDIFAALKKEKVIEIYFNDDSRAPLLIKVKNNSTDNFVIMPVKV